MTKDIITLISNRAILAQDNDIALQLENKQSNRDPDDDKDNDNDNDDDNVISPKNSLQIQPKNSLRGFVEKMVRSSSNTRGSSAGVSPRGRNTNEFNVPDNCNEDITRNLSLNSNSSHKRTSTVDIVPTQFKADENTIRLGKLIIYAFFELYYKYAAANSEYSINIGSRTRKELRKNFDPHDYTIWLHDQELAKHGSSGGIFSITKAPTFETSIWNRLRGATETDGKKQHMPNKHDAYFVKEKYTEYVEEKIKIDESKKNYNYKNDKNDKNETVFTEKDALEWILTKLLTLMEPAAKEISKLMNDSYSRFKTADEEVFKKVVDFAVTKRKEMGLL